MGGCAKGGIADHCFCCSGPWAFVNLTEALSIGEYIISGLKCPPSGPEQLSCLRNISAETITSLPYTMGPNVDGNFLAGQPRDLFKKGSFNPKAPLMVGSNFAEGNIFAYIYTYPNRTIPRQVCDVSILSMPTLSPPPLFSHLHTVILLSRS